MPAVLSGITAVTRSAVAIIAVHPATLTSSSAKSAIDITRRVSVRRMIVVAASTSRGVK